MSAKRKTTKKGTATKKAARTTGAKTTTNFRPSKRDLQIRTAGFEKTRKTRTKSQILRELSASTGLSKREITNFFDNLSALIRNDLTKGVGTFQVPGLLKVQVVKKPAVPARKGVNPFTGQEMMFKAKPARNVVRARPLKGLKDMVK